MGVDIGTQRIRLLELDRSGEQFRVLAYASEPVPDQAIRNFQIVEPEAVAAAILRALERSGSATRDATIAVSGPAVISKTILMPANLDDAEMEQQILFDAAHHIPHPVEEVNLDFQVLHRDPDNPDFNRVLLVACRRDHIEMRTATMEMAHMRVRVIDVEEYALQNACRLLAGVDDNSCVAVVDVGPEHTRMTIQHQAQSLYARELAIGSASMENNLLSGNELTDFEQLKAHLRASQLAADTLASAVAEFAEQLAPSIDRALAFYQSTAAAEDREVERVIVTGAPTVYPGLDEALGRYLPWPVGLGNPLAGMLASAAARRNHVDSDAPTLMLAAGLALRGLA